MLAERLSDSVDATFDSLDDDVYERQYEFDLALERYVTDHPHEFFR